MVARVLKQQFIVTIRCINHDSFTLHAVKPVQPGCSQEEQHN